LNGRIAAFEVEELQGDEARVDHLPVPGIERPSD
jgi:hypothetical protein